MNLRTYHHGDLRRALLDAAVRHIATDGVDALSLRALARDVGVTHAAPYRHFESKGHLLAAIAEEGFQILNTMVGPIFGGGPTCGRPSGSPGPSTCASPWSTRATSR